MTTQTAWAYSTVQQFTAKHTAFNTGGLRSLIFNEHQNGLAKSGAIVRIGRKVLVREDLFFSWVESQNKAVA
jgi:predicted DCC family thiol-disulfide oxidoreductase YuxK